MKKINLSSSKLDEPNIYARYISAYQSMYRKAKKMYKNKYWMTETIKQLNWLIELQIIPNVYRNTGTYPLNPTHNAIQHKSVITARIRIIRHINRSYRNPVKKKRQKL